MKLFKNLVVLFTLAFVVPAFAVVHTQISTATIGVPESHKFTLLQNCEAGVELVGLNDLMRSAAQSVGATVGVSSAAIDGRMVHNCAIGYSNPNAWAMLNADPSGASLQFELASPYGPYRLASTTKRLVRAAVWQMVQDGQLSLSDIAFPLSGVTPSDGVARAWHSDCAVQHLLSHTCGAVGRYGSDGSAKIANPSLNLPLDMKTFMNYVSSMERTTSLGTYSYSDYGYMLLGMIIEKRSGMSLVQYINTKVLKPIGIKDYETVLASGATQYGWSKWTDWANANPGASETALYQKLGELVEGREPLEQVYSSRNASIGSDGKIIGDDYESCWEYGNDCQYKPASDGLHIANQGGSAGIVMTGSALLRFVDNYCNDDGRYIGSGYCFDRERQIGIHSGVNTITGQMLVNGHKVSFALFLNRATYDSNGETAFSVAFQNKLGQLMLSQDFTKYNGVDLWSVDSQRVLMQTYYHAGLKYRVLVEPQAAADLDRYGSAVTGFVKLTGVENTFYGWNPRAAGVEPIYRGFYYRPDSKSEHFVSNVSSSRIVAKVNPQVVGSPFHYETAMFGAKPLNALGGCDAGSTPLYSAFRAVSSTLGSNHAYSTNEAYLRGLGSEGYAFEGPMGCVMIQ